MNLKHNYSCPLLSDISSNDRQSVCSFSCFRKQKENDRVCSNTDYFGKVASIQVGEFRLKYFKSNLYGGGNRKKVDSDSDYSPPRKSCKRRKKCKKRTTKEKAKKIVKGTEMKRVPTPAGYQAICAN